MILHKKQAKKLKHFGQTIDLKYMDAKQYVDKVEKNNTKFGKMKKYMSTAGLIWFFIMIVGLYIVIPGKYAVKHAVGVAKAEKEYEYTIGEKIRLERLNNCEIEYKKSGINEKFIYKQVPAVRCATYMTLVYAYESKFEGKVGNTQKCLHMNNCWGMKGNGVETPAGFIHFNTVNDGRAYFAKKYFQFHYKKDIRTFVTNWSMTDRETYIAFMRARYWKTYNELERLYFTNGKI